MERAAHIAIGVATAQEARFARTLCPTLYRTGSAPDRVLVARAADGAALGLAAIAWRVHDRPPGFPLHVQVREDARRRGVGRALVHAAIAACAHDTERVHGWHALAEDDGATAFARATGFAVLRRVLDFEAGMAEMRALIEPLHARIHRAMPASARLLALADAPKREVAELVGATFGSRHEAVLTAMDAATPNAYDLQRSVVLLSNGRVQAALLARWLGGVPHVDVTVVAPGLRHGWANVALLHRAISQGCETGARAFRFRCEDTVRDTVRLATRVGARRLGAALHFTAPVAAFRDGAR